MSVKITFLGTNGWYTTKTGNTACVFVDAPEAYVILDAGNGLCRIDEWVKSPKKPIYIFLSHFHLDHISGLHTLDKFHFKQGYTICTMKGGRKILDQIVRQPFTAAFKDLPSRVNFIELNEGVNTGFPFGLECRFLVHSAPCLGFRLQFGKKTVAYCTDTGICPAAVRLGRDADILITECAYKSGQQVATWPHLNPEDAAELAKEAAPGRLVLMHFDAVNYPTMGHRMRAQTAARKVFKNTLAARDGFSLTL